MATEEILPDQAAKESGGKSPPPTIRVSIREGTAAYVEILPPVPVEERYLRQVLTEHGVVAGLLDDKIADVAAFPPQEAALVAQGRPAARGEDARIEYFFMQSNSPHPKEQVDGRVDHREVSGVDNAYPGQVLARKIPPTDGTEGLSVKGDALPAQKGKDVNLLPGKNVQISADGMEITASIAGLPLLDKGRVSVLALMEVQDIDFSTGNISFEGTLRVRGNVLPGFHVQATEDIEVDGFVEGAFLKAGRDVKVKGSCRAKSHVEAERDILVHYVDSETVLRSGGSITIETDSVHGLLEARHRISVKRVLVGGMAKAGESVDARIMGAVSETPTRIEVGIADVDAQVEALQAEIEETQASYDKLSSELKDAMAGTHTPEKIQASRRALQAKVAMERKLSVLNTRRQELEHYHPDLVVKAHDRAFGGCLVIMGGVYHHVHNKVLAPRFHLVDGFVEVSGP